MWSFWRTNSSSFFPMYFEGIKTVFHQLVLISNNDGPRLFAKYFFPAKFFSCILPIGKENFSGEKFTSQRTDSNLWLNFLPRINWQINFPLINDKVVGQKYREKILVNPESINCSYGLTKVRAIATCWWKF